MKANPSWLSPPVQVLTLPHVDLQLVSGPFFSGTKHVWTSFLHWVIDSLLFYQIV